MGAAKMSNPVLREQEEQGDSWQGVGRRQASGEESGGLEGLTRWRRGFSRGVALAMQGSTFAGFRIDRL